MCVFKISDVQICIKIMVLHFLTGKKNLDKKEEKTLQMISTF